MMHREADAPVHTGGRSGRCSAAALPRMLHSIATNPATRSGEGGRIGDRGHVDYSTMVWFGGKAAPLNFTRTAATQLVLLELISQCCCLLLGRGRRQLAPERLLDAVLQGLGPLEDGAHHRLHARGALLGQLVRMNLARERAVRRRRLALDGLSPLACLPAARVQMPAQLFQCAEWLVVRSEEALEEGDGHALSLRSELRVVRLPPRCKSAAAFVGRTRSRCLALVLRAPTAFIGGGGRRLQGVVAHRAGEFNRVGSLHLGRHLGAAIDIWQPPGGNLPLLLSSLVPAIAVPLGEFAGG
eukprot:6957566-Prymnesium_polylepis.2